ncbi:hypothetical protein [Methylomonas rapida]|uniref:VCBS repeat-containing protein n=1 Tax=Methylomonas rapida TaxID=2963939 RepID=A0ABY7GNY2_9GAMM|nr:hypothetical protein [Methylomonas rapida]WAR46185.1 hypothetical protein NM686_006610 [Methylomonas rapida]
MIIDSAKITMHGQHRQQQQTKRTESLQVWRNPPQNPAENRPPRMASDQVKLSDVAKAAGTQEQELDLEQKVGPKDALAIQIIRRLVKEMTGKELKLFEPEELQGEYAEISYQAPQQPPARQQNSGFGLVYERSVSYQESESTTFNAAGTVTTRDGKTIDFSVSLAMSRSFYTEFSEAIRIGDAAKIDPLVINFDGDAAELGDTLFQFDIDADGALDQIAAFKSNSGMLALDKNQDGKINDGSELFGPKTGNGFQELAAYDEDGNQFIDEADAIYQQLRIWQRHEDGTEQLVALGDKNIGAIYLGHVSTPFQLKGEENRSLGEVASSGVYLSEDGKVGTVQQINFTA